MEKERVVSTLRELADILEVADANTFEVAAYRNAAQSLDDWDGNLEQTVQDQNVTSIPAVGKGLGQLISNLVSTGHSEELERIRGLVPSELPQILKIRGLGPKRVKLLWQELDIDCPASLRKAAINGNVKNLKGFGPKLLERILSGLDYLEGSRTPPKPKTTAVAVQTAHAGGRLFAKLVDQPKVNTLA